MSEIQQNELFSSPDTWLLNVGYISENSEQNLILYGYISSRGVANVELMINTSEWLIKYAVVLNSSSYRRFRFQKWLESKTGLFFKLVLFSFLKMFGSYNPSARIAKCVRDYAGNRWKTQVEVMNVKQYNKAINDSGTKGWFFQNGFAESGVVHKDERDVTTPATGM